VLQPTVVYDACVLYPAPLRDLLMWLALAGLFRARWTDEIHTEWMENVLRDRPDLSRERLERTRKLMDSHVRDCLVSGYRGLIDAPSLPDPDDRHVLAAAIHCRAELIVTFDLRHFPHDALAPHRVEAIHPDRFVAGLLARSPTAVYSAFRSQRRTLRNPSQTAEELIDTLERQGLAATATSLRGVLQFL
jgi:predicted nucleic acid-binding protein